MDAHRTKVLQILLGARAEMAGFKKDDLTPKVIYDWMNRWKNDFGLVDSLSSITPFNINLHDKLNPIRFTVDKDILDESRSNVVGFLDNVISSIDRKQIVKPILDELITKITDKKLSAFLKEFNASKDGQPNIAAIAFRTILAITIKLRAKKTKPASDLAKVKEDDTDKFDVILEKAVTEKDGIFDSGEKRLLKRFWTGGLKDTFDNVAHKLGENHLIDKDDLSDAVKLEILLLQRLI